MRYYRYLHYNDKKEMGWSTASSVDKVPEGVIRVQECWKRPPKKVKKARLEDEWDEDDD
jgi:hypothetical protein